MLGFPILLNIISIIDMVSNTDSEIPGSFLLNSFTYFPFMMAIFMFGFFGWFYAIAVGLQKYVPQEITMKVKKFKFFFFFPLIYLSLFILWFSIMFTGLLNTEPSPYIFILLVPAHIFSMVCMFYIVYFTAKTVKTIEQQREVKFGEFVGEFFLLYLYPIGLWFIQPKVNKLISKEPQELEA